ncbi:MAG: RidA family protein [Acidimicrobiales bacterium]
MVVELVRQPQGLGPPLGRYSHVGRGEGQLVAIAGQVGVDASGTLVAQDFASQAAQAYANLEIALKSAGCGLSDILKMTTYLVDADLIPEFMRVRTTLFNRYYPDGCYPPNTLLVVKRLVEPELLFEVEALAVRSS